MSNENNESLKMNRCRTFYYMRLKIEFFQFTGCIKNVRFNKSKVERINA